MYRRPLFATVLATVLATVIGLGWGAASLAQTQTEPQAWEGDIAELRHRWERIITAMPEDRREAALEALRDAARGLLARL